MNKLICKNTRTHTCSLLGPAYYIAEVWPGLVAASGLIFYLLKILTKQTTPHGFPVYTHLEDQNIV